MVISTYNNIKQDLINTYDLDAQHKNSKSRINSVSKQTRAFTRPLTSSVISTKVYKVTLLTCIRLQCIYIK